MSNKQSHCWHYLPVCQAALPNSEKALHQPKVTGKSNLRVLSLSGTSYLGQGLSWPPFCWARPEDSPGAPGGPRGEGGGMGATDAFPHPSHLPPGQPGARRVPEEGCGYTATPDDPPAPGCPPARSPPRPPLRASQRRAAAPTRPGPAELPGLRSAPPARRSPAPQPDRAGEEEQEEERRGGGERGTVTRWGRGAQGGPGTTPGRRPHVCARSRRDPRASSPW